MEAIRLIRHCAKYVSERPQVNGRPCFVLSGLFLTVKVPYAENNAGAVAFIKHVVSEQRT